MIFVTVGTGKFDKLVEETDKAAGNIKEEVVMQIGNGSYLPKNCRFFRFKPNLKQEYKKARLIIAHGGAGTTFELLSLGKKLVSVANLDRTDQHQEDILQALSEERHLIWCKELEKIEDCIRMASKSKLKKYKVPKCEIANKINEFLG